MVAPRQPHPPRQPDQPDQPDQADQPHEHRDVRGGGARAAMFGLSDGLVTNISLVLGVAGASPGGQVVRLVGVAGLVAGAFSMAAGEFLSMTAQRELMERELRVERRSLRQSPEGEAQELRVIYERRGIDPSVARDMVHEVMQDPELALETHAREELGINPHHLGSPVQAAVSSFVTFAVGAFIPLLPWLLARGNGAIVASVVLSAVAAVTVGIVLAAFTQRPMLRSAVRQLAITALAAAVTYGVGRAIGTGAGIS
jgi:VIT1/CCC1 family predicted Fe2+/Mn2+ transporter